MKHIAKILVLAMLLSLLCIGGTALAADDCVGVWEYNDYYMWYQFNEDGTWAEYYREGLALDGFYEQDGSTVDLYVWDGTFWTSMELDGSVLTDEDSDTMFPSSLPAFETSELAELGAPGVWKYAGDDMTAWIQIYEGGNYLLYNEDGAYKAGTVRILDDGTVGLMDNYDDADEDALMALTFDGDTAVDTEGEEFIRSELPYDTIPAGYSAAGTTAAGSAAADSDVIGVWEYDEYYNWIEFNADGTWDEYYETGLSLNGIWEATSDGAQMYLPDGTEWYLMVLDGSTMTDDDGDTLFASSLPTFEDIGLNDTGAVGVWEQELDDDTYWIQIYEGGTYLVYAEDGAFLLGDAEAASDGSVVLYYTNDDDEDEVLMTITVDGDTAEDETGIEMVRSELPFGSSSVSAPAAQTASGYDGVWEYTDYYLWIEIDEADGTFVIYDEDGERLSGTLAGPDADGSVTLNAEGESVTVYLEDDDTLVDWDGDTLFRSELPDF